MNKIRIAFAGFRHGHIFGLLEGVGRSTDLELVAACEEDADTRSQLAAGGKVRITHESFERMLADTPCDAVAIGDYYGKRGGLAIAALAAGKHVICDKPLCTKLAELERIGQLASQRKLALGLMLDLRAGSAIAAARKAILGGAIGPVQTIGFAGQHPLLWGSRPQWYFQDGRQGGTINDIFIHAADGIEWLTGRRIVEVVAARTWNSSLPQCPAFQVGAHLMLRLDNEAGVLGDVSYFGPTKTGYTTPTYWRFTVHGERGQIEWSATAPQAWIATHDDDAPRQLPAEPREPEGYLRDFVAQVRGQSAGVWLTNEQVLRASRIALLTQQAADQRETHIAV